MNELMYGECPHCHRANTIGHTCKGHYPLPAEPVDLWHYCRNSHPKEGDDARKIVTLMEDGMIWIGIRTWHNRGWYWMNGSEPERAEVLAWMDLPQPAQKRWVHGILT